MVNKGYDKEIWSPEQLKSMDKFIQGKSKDPPLLSDDDIVFYVTEYDIQKHPFGAGLRVAKAQRESDIRWYKDAKGHQEGYEVGYQKGYAQRSMEISQTITAPKDTK